MDHHVDGHDGGGRDLHVHDDRDHDVCGHDDRDHCDRDHDHGARGAPPRCDARAPLHDDEALHGRDARVSIFLGCCDYKLVLTRVHGDGPLRGQSQSL